MLKAFENGFEAVGHVEGLGSDLTAAYVKLDDRGAVISVPELRSPADAFNRLVGDESVDVPLSLRFHGTGGSFVLAACQDIGGTASTRGPAVSRIRARRVIECGNGDMFYDEVDGMTSEVDGLASWAGMSTVTQTYEWDEATGTSVVVLRAENQPPIHFGGDGAATIESSFSYDPRPKGNVFGITDRAILRTRSISTSPWQDHAAVHHMFQDLMCLVFGQARLSRIKSIKREDDQPNVKPGDHRRQWREVYEPNFGRSMEGTTPLDRREAEPLFRLVDCDRAAVTAWIDGWHLWSRPTWIAVTTMFQKGTPVESRLLQIGVSLEALGFALWTEEEPGGERTPTFIELVERVTAAVPMEHVELTGKHDAGAWCRAFNEAFKGAKHADKPLPESSEAQEFADQGLNLIRTWLGIRLGVELDLLKERLSR